MAHGDDQELVNRTRQGDSAAFTGLIDRYKYAVYGICLSLAGDFDLAEDLAQEAFIKAYLHLNRLKAPERFGNWLRIIAANECRLHLRRNRPVAAPDAAPSEHLLPPDQQTDAEDQRAGQERLESAALLALGRLPEKNRQTLTLHYLGGHSVAQVAEFLGDSVPAVKMRLYRARRQLQKEALHMVESTLTGKALGPEFKGGIRVIDATPLFSDIAGFEPIANALSTPDLIALLNAYMTDMTDIVLRHGGVLDKYEGDAIIAFWEASHSPQDHAIRACHAALDMQAKLAEWRREGKPDLYVCYGLNTGQILVGDMGSRQLRDDSIMGDPVNLAAYLERENRTYGTHITIGEHTYAAAGDAIEARELDRIRVLRSAEPVTIYELLARKGELDDRQARTVDLYRQGLDHYRAQRWENARGCFCKALQQTPEDGPSRLYRQRCDTLMSAPPDWLTGEWDGVFGQPEIGILKQNPPRPDPERLQRQVQKIVVPPPPVPQAADRINAVLAPSTAHRLAQNPGALRLEGAEVDLTAFFSDIRNFSDIIDRLAADEAVSLLYDYHSEMTDIVLGYEGVVDKYEGDAVIAFWGAPVPVQDHALRGCLAALDMQARLAEWRQGGKPDITVCCGLGTGPSVVGNMGSHQQMDYTILGNYVNLAARLERLNRDYGTCVLISEATCAAVGDAVEVRELDRLRVAWRTQPVTIYEAVSRKGELPEGRAEVIALFSEGLKHYRNRDWKAALAVFDKALKLHPEDGPSQIFRTRCETFLADPPEWLTEDWDGAMEM